MNRIAHVIFKNKSLIMLFLSVSDSSNTGLANKDEACPVDNGNKHLAVLCFSRSGKSKVLSRLGL